MRDWVLKRKEICKACELNKKILGVHVCSPIAAYDTDGRLSRGCGCILSAKIRLSNQACPLGKWGKESKKLDRATEHALNSAARQKEKESE